MYSKDFKGYYLIFLCCILIACTKVFFCYRKNTTLLLNMLESEVSLQDDIINKIHNFLQILSVEYSSETSEVFDLQLKKLLSNHEKLFIFSNIIKNNVCLLKDKNIIGLKGKFGRLDDRKTILYDKASMSIIYDAVSESLLILHGIKNSAIGYFVPINQFAKYYNEIKIVEIEKEAFIIHSKITNEPTLLNKKNIVVNQSGILKNAIYSGNYLSSVSIDDIYDLILTELYFLLSIMVLYRLLQQEKQKAISEFMKSNSFNRNALVRSEEISEFFANQILELYRIYSNYGVDIPNIQNAGEVSIFGTIERSIRLNASTIEKFNIRLINQTDDRKFAVHFSNIIFEKVILSLVEIILKFLTKDRFIKFSCLITVDEVELIIEDNGLDLDFSYLEGKFTSKIEGVFFYNWRELKLAVENLKGTLLAGQLHEI